LLSKEASPASLESVAVSHGANIAGVDAEYRLLREEAGLLRRDDLAVLEVTGGEGAEFLQGQLTNDIEALEPGTGCYAALLDRKGKLRSDMVVLCEAPDRILIVLPGPAAPEVGRHLDMYRIGRDAEVHTRSELAVTSLGGPRTPEAIGGVPLGREHSHRTVRLAERDALAVTTPAGADLIAPAPDLDRIEVELASAGVQPVSPEAFEIVRVEAGRPAFGAEMGHDTMPQEAGINERAVSFEKGCYVGQETVARLHYRGKPNRHLRRISASDEIAAGDPIMLGDREVGTVGTAVLSPASGWIGLAIVRREAEPGAGVLVGDVPATVEEIGA
jgi:tRNA-modifying protein YgfZ